MRRSTLSLLAAGAVACFMSWPAVADTFLPDFSTAQFDPAQPINNLYFPMTDTRTYVYSGRDEDGPVDERFEHTNTGPGPVIAGVQTFIQQDREFEDGLLVDGSARASPYPPPLIARGRIARCRRLPMWQHRGGRIV
jgi:hypothetical protein